MKFKFRSKSSMSFPVTHKGRKQFINFTAMGNGTSLFITEDEGLAKKIRSHKWFRENRITEEQVDNTAAKTTDQPLHIPEGDKPAPYSILNRGMSSTPYQAPTASETASSGWRTDSPDSYGMGAKRVDSDASEVDTASKDAATPEDSTSEEDTLQIPAETVSSLTEAKEFFSVNYGIDRSSIKSKDAVAKLCAQYNVEFENYPLS